MIKSGQEFHQHIDRNYFSTKLSDDDETSNERLVINGREKVTYPDGCQGSDGTIYVTYDHNRGPGEITMARFTEEDILARKIISPQSKLKMVMVRPLKVNK